MAQEALRLMHECSSLSRQYQRLMHEYQRLMHECLPHTHEYRRVACEYQRLMREYLEPIDMSLRNENKLNHYALSVHRFLKG